MTKSSKKPVRKPHKRSAAKTLQEIELRVARLEDDLFKTRKAAVQTEARLQEEILGLQMEVKKRDQQIEDLTKTNTYLKNKLFGSQTEKHDVKQKVEETEDSGKPTRKRGQQPGSKGHGRSVKLVANKTEEVVPIQETCCSKCSKAFLIIEATKDSKLIEFHQILEETTYKRQVAVSQCKCFGKVISVADLPRKLFPRTEIGNSLWTHFLLSKFLFGVPSNRIQKALSLKGVELPLGTLNDGFKRIDSLLNGLYEQIKDHAKGADLWNADETSWRVMDADQRRYWLWLIASPDAVAYLLDQSRSAKVPNEFFESASGVLISDRYSAYKNLREQIRKAWCWVHVRRDFLELLKGVKKHKAWAKKWLVRIGKLFAANHKRFKLFESGSTKKEEWKASNERIHGLLRQFQREFKKEISANNLAASQLKILRSLNRHWQGLTLFAEDPRIPMDNNRAERLLRGSVILRKNCYGSGSEWSGHFAAKVMTIFHTWLINGLNPEALLEAFLGDNSINSCAPNLNQYLPWKMPAARKREFALPANFKRPA